jgi:hypothetical protein
VEGEYTMAVVSNEHLKTVMNKVVIDVLEKALKEFVRKVENCPKP